MIPNQPFDNNPYHKIIMFLAVVGILTIFGLGIAVGIGLVMGG